MVRRKLLNGVSIASAGLVAAVAGPAAFAQTAPVDDNDRVVITGSYISGTAEDAALPVDVIDAEELEKKGSPTALEFIKSLPYVGPVLGESNQFTPAAQVRLGGGSINLRGLGAQRTLVLLNGRRFMDGFSDTNLLPIAAVGRVEILKDGAAATYGSDAIGGVVNFITREGFEGLEIGGDYRLVDDSDGDYSANLAWGWNGENGNILVSAGYQHRSALSTTERDWAYPPLTTNPAGWSVLGNPGSYLPLSAGFLPTAGGVLRDANCTSLGGVENFSGLVPICTWSYVPFLNLIEKEDRYQVYGEANADLSDNTRLHLEVLYAQSEQPELRSSPGYPPTSGPTGPGSIGVFSTPITNPGAVTAMQQAGVPTAGISATSFVSLTLWRPFATGGNPADGLGGKSNNKYEFFRTSASLEGEFSEALEWSLAGTYSRSTTHFDVGDVLIDRLQRALNGLGGPNCTGTTPGANGCQFFNPFSNAIAGNPALGLTNPGFVSANANSDELSSWLVGKVSTDSVTDYWVVDAILNGDSGIALGGGNIEWAAGAQFRRSEFDFRPGALNDASVTPCPVVGATNCTFRTGPFIFQGQSVPAQLEDDVYAVFAEASLPFSDTLSAQLAVRYEDYGGSTGSTTNPKLAVKWDAMDWLSFRASAGTTFRGPTAGNRTPGGITGLQGIIAAGNAFKSVDFFGNPDVGPETADTYNVGAILDTGPFRAMVDVWHYKLYDQIVTVPANVIATAVAGTGNGSQAVNCSSPLRGLITFNNNNTCTQGVTVANDIARVRSDTTNGPTVETSGIDAQADYTFDNFMGGSLTLAATGSYVMDYKQDAFFYNGAFVSAAYNAVGKANYDRLPGTVSRLRGNVYAEYSTGPHNLRLTMNYIDGVRDNRGPTVVQGASNLTGCTVANAATTTGCQLVTFGLEVDDFTTFDLNYRLLLPEDVTLTAGVLNLLDEDPPGARLELSYDPFIGNPYGRTLKVGLQKKF